MSSDSWKYNGPGKWKLEDVISLIIVCIIFVTLSDCLGLFKRLVCGICGGRNQGQRRLSDESIPDDPSVQLQLQNRGLEFSMVQSLPTSQFKKNEGEQIKTLSVDCAICLGEFEEGEWLKHLSHCGHSFHVSCIDTWFQSHSNCPLCRSSIHHHPCSVSTDALIEPLRREDFVQR